MESLQTPSQAIAVLDKVRFSLAETEDLDRIKMIRNRAEAVRHYARSAALGLELQNRAAEVKLRAERKVGTLLASLGFHGGDRKSAGHAEGISLRNLGLSRSQSAHWQLEASVPEEVFAEYLREVTAGGKELTSRGLVRLAQMHREATRRQPNNGDLFQGVADALRLLVERRRTFACIYADPPMCRGKQPRLPWTEGLIKLPIRRLACENAHVHFWVTPELLAEGMKVLRAWGFRYESSLVWMKPPIGYGLYWRQAHDVLLLGVRGSLPFRDSGLESWQDGQETAPSDRSRDIRELIERVGFSPYLDLFGNHAAPGWTLAVPAATSAFVGTFSNGDSIEDRKTDA